MKKCMRLAFLFPTLLVIGLSFATAQAQPHTHADRSHAHPLPVQGVGHKHGNGAPGRASGGQQAVPRAQQQQDHEQTAKAPIASLTHTVARHMLCKGSSIYNGNLNNSNNNYNVSNNNNNMKIYNIHHQRSAPTTAPTPTINDIKQHPHQQQQR